MDLLALLVLLVFLRQKKSIAELLLGLGFRVLGFGLHNCTTRQLMAAQTLAPVESVEAGISSIFWSFWSSCATKKALPNSCWG